MIHLAIDIGYNDCKVVCGDDRQVHKQFKFPSVIAKVNVNALVKDDRVFELDGEHYYVGDDALALETSAIIDISDYRVLEFSAPLFVAKVLKSIDPSPNRLTLGLSVAQITNSGHYLERIKKFLASNGIQCDVDVLPQGLASKITVDKYGVDYPNTTTDFNVFQNYIGVNCGGNTLDIYQVINGVSSSNTLEGIEEAGTKVIAGWLQKYILENDSLELSIAETKSILVDQHLRRRGKIYDYSEVIKIYKKDYIKHIVDLVEDRFGDQLDKADALVISGGGSYLLKDQSDDFIQVPRDLGEYYDCIGYYLYSVKKSKA